MSRVIQMQACILSVILSSSFCLPLYADSCDDAKDKVQEYLNMYEELRRMIPEEQKEFVEAACTADDEELAKVLDEAGHRAESQILSQADHLKSLHDDASKSLDAAINADECKDKKDDLSRMQDRVEEIANRIDKMGDGVKMGSNPVFNAMRDLGQKTHKEYQSMNSSFDNVNPKYGSSEVSISDISRRVDFMDAKGCQVVELKPDSNSSAQSDGFDDAKKARDWLNDPENLATFIQKYPAYANCKKFVARVDCYHYCPAVLDDGSLQVGSIDWKSGCKGPE